MKDIVTPVPPEEVRNVIKKCLENAALVNYTRISEYAKIEGKITKLKWNKYYSATEEIFEMLFTEWIKIYYLSMLSCNVSPFIFEYDYNIYGCINELCSNAEIAS